MGNDRDGDGIRDVHDDRVPNGTGRLARLVRTLGRILDHGRGILRAWVAWAGGVGIQGTFQKVEVGGKDRDGEEGREGRAYGVGDRGGRACVADEEVGDDVAKLQERGHHDHPLAGEPFG